MKISPTLTPFRWYDQYYSQDRFNTECNSICEFNLITDKRRLLPFQFRRPKSPAVITNWILRPYCNEPFKQMLPEADQNFVDGSMRWQYSVDGVFTFSCQKVCVLPTAITGALSIASLFTIGRSYTVRFTISDYVGIPAPPIQLNVKNGATIVFSALSSGVFSFSFVATSTSLALEFINGKAGETLCIEDVNILEQFVPAVDDINLETFWISTKTVGNQDIIGYCGLDLNVVLPEGKYYSIIIDSAGRYYFSEVFYIKNFEHTKSPYVSLEWWNTCDLSDTSYNLGDMVIFCPFKNRLYLEDGVTSKPDYPFKEEVEEDGNSEQHKVFQKWNKIVSLFANKVPEFIVDALTAIKLHDNIYYNEPLRLGQYTLEPAIEVKNVDYEVGFILQDCFATVQLKMTLLEQIVDETCCVNLPYTPCLGCTHVINGINNEDIGLGYALFIGYGPYPVDGFYTWNGITWVISPLTNQIICDTVSGRYYAYTFGQYRLVPTVTFLLTLVGNSFLVVGFALPNTYVNVEYSLDGGFTWVQDINYYTDTQIAGGVIVTPALVPVSSLIFFRIYNYSFPSCNYGLSPDMSVLSNP